MLNLKYERGLNLKNENENDNSGLTPNQNKNEHEAQDQYGLSREVTDSKPPEQDDTMITQYAEPITHNHTSHSTPSFASPKSEQTPQPAKSDLPASVPNSPRVPELSQQLEKDLVQVFKLLADETRLKILFYLGREKELHVSALCERLGQSQPAVSHHLALLRVAGLIEPRRDGKHNYYSVLQSTFHEIVGELFKSFTEISNTNEVRFDDFIFSQESK